MTSYTAAPATAPEEFISIYESGKAQLLRRTLISDIETPVSAFIKLAGEEPNSLLLESVEGGEQLGRYSIIGTRPDILWRSFGAQSEINRKAIDNPDAFATESGAPLDNLKRLFAESQIDTPDDFPPMSAGVFGYLGYDMVRQMEVLGMRPDGGLDTPDSIFMRPTIVAVFDNVRQEIVLITPVRPNSKTSAHEAYAEAEERLDFAHARLASPASQHLRAAPPRDVEELDFVSNVSPEEYQNNVARAKEYIRAGDIFQVVLSQRFSVPFDAPALDLYRALRRTNPSPFLFYLNCGGFSLVGSSPEILVRVRDNKVTIRPIAGTRPRGQTRDQDSALAEELLADPKERAEHLMLLDLGRNDVGRSTKIGSVEATEQFIIERYSHVMHIVSNVVGDLRDDVHPVDAVSAGFPAGTVTGAPKIRAMQIIDELEKTGRSVYGGAIGYFSSDGNVDTCIALRTAIVKDGTLYVQAGAGIVADSDPASEQAECENKARALFAAARDVLTQS